jgi:sigma-54 specific flagellar transcriptional regulator A
VKDLDDSEILGSSSAIVALRSLIRQCAGSNAPVLIHGESGVGKELVSRELHNHSARYSQRLVAINCGAIPAQLLESELFGHRKGSFTGATCDRKGRFELANNGTLFLDEIGDMPLDLQVKFLRVLEERKIEPVGADRPIDIDVRIVAATHRDLTQMIAEGSFREDLYYRLNVIPLSVPRLADRSSDIGELAVFFAAKFAAGAKPIRLTHRTLHILEAYSWPGNVRELANFIQRLSVLFASSTIDLAHIPREFLPKEMVALLDEVLAMPESNASAADKGEVSSEDDSEIHEQFDFLSAEFGSTARTPELVTRLADVDDALSDVADALDDPFASLESALSTLEEQSSANEFESIIRLSENLDTLPQGGVPTRDILNTLEANLIRTALAQTKGNVSHAAGLLQLGRTTVIQKMSKYDIVADTHA